MKKLAKILLAALVVLVLLAAGLYLGSDYWLARQDRRAKATLAPEVPVLSVEGMSFRDLNKNGRLDPYEDRRAPVEARIDDLLGQMTEAVRNQKEDVPYDSEDPLFPFGYGLSYEEPVEEAEEGEAPAG